MSLAALQGLQGAGGGDLVGQEARAGHLDQGQVPLQHDLLGLGRGAGQAHPPGEFTGGGGGAFAQPGIGGPVGHQHAEALRIGQDPSHHLGVHDRTVGVGDVDAAGLGHQSDLGHTLAHAALGRGAGGQDVDQAGVPGPAADEVHHRGLVDHRVRVGLDHEGRHAARRRRLGGRAQGLAGLEAGLAGLGAQVDQARDQQRPAGVDDLMVRADCTRIGPGDDGLDGSVPDEERPAGVEAGRRVENPRIQDGQWAVGGGAHSWNLSSHFSWAGATYPARCSSSCTGSSPKTSMSRWASRTKPSSTE